MTILQRRAALLCATLALAGTARATAAQPDVTLSFDLVKRVTLHEPVLFSYVVKNDTGQDIWVSAGDNGLGAFAFEVIGPTGRRQTGRYMTLDGPSKLDFRVRAGQTSSLTTAIGQWLDLSEIGVYTVTVTFRGSLIAGEENLRARRAAGERRDLDGTRIVPEFVESQSEAEGRQTRTFALEVLPRDEAKLQQVCQSLYARALNPRADAGPGNAQQLLGTIRDVIAIPYVEALLAAEDPDRPIISRPGRYFELLVEIGAPEARLALERLTHHPNPGMAQAARSALRVR